MKDFSAVNDNNENNLQVIWDLGRRCTYSCSYCPPHRRNNWSATASYDELVKTADSIKRYNDIYNRYRNNDFRVACSFTGGEPTVNPSFFPFLEYLTKNFPEMKRTLTTNGFYTTRRLYQVIEHTEFTTISYHCEATSEQKIQVKKNMQTMIDEKYNFKVNVMFHQDPQYFQDCIELCEWLDSENIGYTPRVIGDEGDVKKGIKNKTVHVYTEDQMEWFKKYWARKNFLDKMSCTKKNTNVMNMAIGDNSQHTKKEVGQKIGRPCCGSRKFEILDENHQWTSTGFVPKTNFNDWSCMVNWYFLYIHQEVDRVWHHQTCQVNLDSKIGPICKVSELDKYCDELELKFMSGSFPYIRCPKTHCGCGLCAPKAKNDSMAEQLFFQHTTNLKPIFQSQPDDIGHGTLKKMVENYDKENGNES